jgi:hypothetical protein
MVGREKAAGLRRSAVNLDYANGIYEGVIGVKKRGGYSRMRMMTFQRN